jgi:hypothetical protein
MRQLRKLIQTGSTANTSMIIPTIYHAATIKAINQKLVLQNMPGWWTDNQLQGAGDTVTYQNDFETTMAAGLVSPGAQIPESEMPYSGQITLQVKKAGIRPMITTELIEDGKYDEMSRQQINAIFKMAQFVDQACGRGMTQESGAFPTSGINSLRLIERAPTVTASGFTLPDDLLKMVGAIEANNGRATDVVMHPNFYLGIRGAAWFAPAVQVQDGATGFSGPNGLVGTAYGLRWWQSTNLAYSGTTLAGSGVVMVYDATQNPFVFLNKRPLTVKSISDVERDIVGLAFTQRFNAMNIVPSAVCWVTGVYGTYYREFKDRAL